MQTSGLQTRQHVHHNHSALLQTSSRRPLCTEWVALVSIKLYLQHSWGVGFYEFLLHLYSPTRAP